MSAASKQEAQMLEREQDQIAQDARSAVRSFPTAAARAEIVNRTHRVIRERAQTMRDERSKTRSLWAPMGVCSVLLVMVCYAAWTMLSQNDAVPSNMPEANEQISILTLWFLPVSVAVLARVWFRRGRGRYEDNNSR